MNIPIEGSKLNLPFVVEEKKTVLGKNWGRGVIEDLRV